jgi:hypothetical protein
MDEPYSQETEIPDLKISAIPCGSCDRETRHKVLAETKVHWEYGQGMVDVWCNYQIVQCQGCLTISFCDISACSDDEIYEGDGTSYLPEIRKFYPSRIAGRPQMQEVQLLPFGVQQIYEEAHGALCAELQIMAGFGIRAIVEAVCKEREVRGSNLKERIDSLADAGFITPEGAKIFHHLRFMGNAAAHDMKAHAPSEMNAAFDVIEYLLQGVYVLPRQAEMLPRRKDG